MKVHIRGKHKRGRVLARTTCNGSEENLITCKNNEEAAAVRDLFNAKYSIFQAPVKSQRKLLSKSLREVQIILSLMKSIISKTGEIHGRGTDRYRWVSRLTKQEREVVRGGGIVLIKDPWFPRPNTTKYKIVTYWRGGYSHKNYNGEIKSSECNPVNYILSKRRLFAQKLQRREKCKNQSKKY